LLHRLGDLEWTRIGWADPITWLRTADATQVLVASLRMLGLVLCYWLAASTLVYVCALASRSSGAIRAAAATTPSAIRRAAGRITVVAVAASTMAGPAAAAVGSTRPVISAPDPIDARVVEAPSDPWQVDPGFLPVTVRRSPPIAAERSSRVEVRSGDTLWGLAERQLATRLGRPPATGEIASYCRTLVAANLPGLRSGDPDLIHPGEIIVLPWGWTGP
jgi:nucleoid-associated protein YgaU